MWQRLKRVHPFWWFVAFFVLLNVLWLGPTLLGGPGLEKGTRAPAFDLPRVDPGATGTVSLEQLRPSPTVLVFWATWCDSCLAEMRVLRAIRGRWSERELDVLGMNVDEDRSAARRFLASHPLPYPNVSAGAAAAAYEVSRLPTVYVLSAGGTVCAGFKGRVGEAPLARAVERCSR